MNKKIHGIIAAMVTPMDAEETVNLSELRHQTDRLIGAGIHGLFCLGTNGEAYVLEKRKSWKSSVMWQNRRMGGCRF